MNEPEAASVAIFVVAARNLSSELLVHALAEEPFCRRCEIAPDVGAVAPALKAPEAPPRALVLIDCIENDFDQVVTALADAGLEPGNRLVLAIYNVYSGWGIEAEALTYGIKGFFYKQDGLELLRKGVRAILGQEVWVSREILMRSAMGNIRQKQSNIQEKTGLSIRELEILRLVAAGAPNEEIAQKLFISPHTVKAHVYNIFRKIEVSNRLQAAAWVAKNL